MQSRGKTAGHSALGYAGRFNTVRPPCEPVFSVRKPVHVYRITRDISGISQGNGWEKWVSAKTRKEKIQGDKQPVASNTVMYPHVPCACLCTWKLGPEVQDPKSRTQHSGPGGGGFQVLTPST